MHSSGPASDGLLLGVHSQIVGGDFAGFVEAFEDAVSLVFRVGSLVVGGRW